MDSGRGGGGGGAAAVIKMRNLPEADASSSRHPRSNKSNTEQGPDQQQASEASYERSVGYRLATEGSYGGDMGAIGTLQIWPKVSSQASYQQLRDVERRAPYHHHSISSSFGSHTSGEDTGNNSITKSTSHSFPNMSALRTPLSVSYKPSMSSIREPPPRKAHNIIHTAISHPNFHSLRAELKRKDDLNVPSKISQPSRSQRLGLSKLFHSRDKESKRSEKEKKKDKNKGDRAQKDKDIYHARAMVAPAEQQDSTVSHRSLKTVFDRNPTENAKINVRRPPRGIKHWFEGLDESDEDFPEVVQTPPGQVTTATFRPSLGPDRLRAAPTSRISPMAEPAQDYFMFSTTDGHGADSSGHSEMQSAPYIHDKSVLHLSSSDEDDFSEPPSPDRWPKHNNHFYRSKSNDADESVFSMQTTMTSGTIPIMNAESLYRTPLPPMPTSHASTTRQMASLPPLRQRHSEMAMSHARVGTAQSIPSSIGSDGTAGTSSTTHVMTVTQEEMALLEMMRRKRAEMQNGNTSPRQAARFPSYLGGFERQNSMSRSIASSTISRDSDRSVLGTVFPAPPGSDRRVSSNSSIMNTSINNPHRPLSNLSDNRYRNTENDKMLAHVAEESDSYMHLLPSTTYTPPSTFHELEAPLERLPASTYGQPATSVSSSDPNPLSHHPRTPPEQTKPALYNGSNRASDPYHLAPDLDFSPMDLLPLPPRAYSPSLSTSRSSTGAGSQFSARTPTDAGYVGVTGLGLGLSDVGENGNGGGEENEAENVICELDVKRNSCLPLQQLLPSPSVHAHAHQAAGEDVLAAWGALGGVPRC